MNDERRESFDEFEKFIRHSEFGKVLELAGKLKGQKSQLATFSDQGGAKGGSNPAFLTLRPKKKRHLQLDGSGSDPQALSGSGNVDDNIESKERPESRRGVRDSIDSRPAFEDSADLIRESLIPPNNHGADSRSAMTRGECLITDSLIDETINSLAEELRLCLDLKKQLRGMARGEELMYRQESKQFNPNASDEQGIYGRDMKYSDRKTTNGSSVNNYEEEEEEESDEKGNMIATKFSKRQTDILTNWMIAHRVSFSFNIYILKA